MSYYKLYRKPAIGKAVRGKLFYCDAQNKFPVCDTLENADYLVPALIYRLAVTQSPRFHRLLPIVQQVPGRSGIRIHRGTRPEHSHGCILVPDLPTEQALTNQLLKEQNDHEEIRIDIISSCPGRG